MSRFIDQPVGEDSAELRRTYSSGLTLGKRQLRRMSVIVRKTMPGRIVGRLILLLLSMILLPTQVLNGQSSTTTARTPGAPAGSYSLGDGDSVNLFTGNLNYELPLQAAGGRGNIQSVLSVVTERQWDMHEKPSELGEPWVVHEYSIRQPNPLALVGYVRLETSSTPTNDACDNQGDRYGKGRVSVSYVESNGTEHTLRDRVSHGLTFLVCAYENHDLGRTFESTSGDFVTYINDADIHFDCYWSGTCPEHVSGYLYFRDGTKARVVDGQIMWTRDNNGNMIEFSYNPGTLGAGYGGLL